MQTGTATLDSRFLAFRVLVGSRAHGLAGPDSDYDYKTVRIERTTNILTLGHRNEMRGTHKISGTNDVVSWEIEKFLTLAVKSNPPVLEAMLAPAIETTEVGDQIRALFPHVWNSHDAFNAFMGFAQSAKEIVQDQYNRHPIAMRNKAGATALRTLFNLDELLSTQTFHVDISDTKIATLCRAFRAGTYAPEEMLLAIKAIEQQVIDTFKDSPEKRTELDTVNALLITIRKVFW